MRTRIRPTKLVGADGTELPVVSGREKGFRVRRDCSARLFPADPRRPGRRHCRVPGLPGTTTVTRRRIGVGSNTTPGLPGRTSCWPRKKISSSPGIAQALSRIHGLAIETEILEGRDRLEEALRKVVPARRRVKGRTPHEKTRSTAIILFRLPADPGIAPGDLQGRVPPLLPRLGKAATYRPAQHQELLP